MSLLLSCGAVPNAQDRDGRTPMHLAVNAATDGSSRAQVVRQLLEIGHANPSIPDGSGMCAVHLAAASGDAEAVVTLLDGGAGVADVDDRHRRTALHMAAAGAHLQVVMALLRPDQVSSAGAPRAARQQED